MTSTGAKNENGLTLKQEAFVQKLMECRNQSEAYRHAYDVGECTSANTVQTEAWKLMQHPDVTHRLKSLQEAAATIVLYNAANAFDELEEARSKALLLDQTSSAVSAIKGKMELVGLGSKKLKIDATIKQENMTEEQQIERIKAIVPQIAPILISLGWREPDRAEE